MGHIESVNWAPVDDDVPREMTAQQMTAQHRSDPRRYLK